MNSGVNSKQQNVAALPEQENVIAGAVGAFLFALAGGAVWTLLSRIGIIAGLSGLIGVVCAIKGYKVFGKVESKKGVVISIIMAALVMVIAWYLCFAWDLLDVYKDWYQAGEIDYVPTYFECVRSGFEFFGEGEILGTYLKDLLIGLAFCALGCFGYVRTAFRRVDTNRAAEAENRINSSDFTGGYSAAPLNAETASPHASAELSHADERMNRLWKAYSDGSLDEMDHAMYVLCEYHSGVNGEGHSGFVFNSESEMPEYLQTLNTVLPDPFFGNLQKVWDAYGTEGEAEAASAADAYFYAHEREIIDIQQRFADGHFD
ncbi:MAG: hypothetical protein II789_04425 [Clostridia bacterium]|nr:hypothetical protein [Clostridia bacterium]